MRRLRFAGFGGQGVVLCGLIFGKAAMRDGRTATHTQSYGSASRGGLTKSDVSIADGEIYDLVHERMDVLVTMSQQSYDAYHGALIDEGGLLFYESDLVRLDPETKQCSFGLQATDLAYKVFGRKIIANMLMIGFVNQIAELVSRDALLRTVGETVPPGTEEKNFAALERGAQAALSMIQSEAPVNG